MKVASLICIALILCVELSNASQMRRFREHTSKHRLRFSSAKDEAVAFTNFAKHDDLIEEHNAQAAQGKHSFQLEHNEFSTKSSKERKALAGHREPKALPSDNSPNKRDITPQKINYQLSNGKIVTVSYYKYSASASETLPKSFDWRQKGWNSPVRNQGQCGSCWSFSTAAAVEAQYKIFANKSLTLSTQQMVDCDSLDYGCDGGFTVFAEQYVMNIGLVPESQYPYTSSDGEATGQCLSSSATRYSIKKFYQVQSDTRSLKSAIVNLGPTVISMDVGEDNLLGFLRKGDIFTSPSCDTNHAVLAVGYGTDSATGRDYFIIKNSWGPSWADNGYFKMYAMSCSLNSWVTPSIRA